MKMKYGYVIDGEQQVKIETPVSVYIGGELKNIDDNYLMNDGVDQND